MFSLSILTFAAVPFLLGSSLAGSDNDKTYKYVLTFSVDGFHSSDLSKYVARRPDSTMAKLLETGYEYTDAFASAPSDSFPGTMNQFTGASPRTTGVWYDDTYDRTYFAPGSDCSGKPGAEVVYDESIDYNSTLLFSGGIDPANLPKTLKNGKCVAVYPHARLRVNTIFEVVRAAGHETAYADKHPAYDIVRGPSGKGLSEGYFPEIAAVANNVSATIAYDQLHVNAFLGWIDGKSQTHAEGSISKMPTLFGGNFQCVSVAQMTKGYNKDLSFTPELLRAIDFVDESLGKVVAKLKSKSLLYQTLIIVASKHGQAPINPALYTTVDPDAVTNATGVPVAFQTSDDIALIFLNSSSDTPTASANLASSNLKLKLKILNIFGGPATLSAMGFGNPLKDPAVPDIIVQPDLGTIYTTSKNKIAEHGGLSDDDRKVACFVSSPGLKAKKFGVRTSTRQVAPTVLKALGLDPKKLEGVEIQGTNALEGF